MCYRNRTLLLFRGIELYKSNCSSIGATVIKMHPSKPAPSFAKRTLGAGILQRVSEELLPFPPAWHALHRLLPCSSQDANISHQLVCVPSSPEPLGTQLSTVPTPMLPFREWPRRQKCLILNSERNMIHHIMNEQSTSSCTHNHHLATYLPS